MNKRKRSRLVCLVLAGAMAVMVSIGVAGSAQAAAPISPAMTNGYYELVNFGTGKCADVINKSTSNGAYVQEYDCKGTDNQLWLPLDLGNGYFEIVNKGSNLCLDADVNVPVDGTRIRQLVCGAYTPEQWQLQIQSTFPAAYVLANRAGKCLDLNNDSPNNGTPIQLWSCGGAIPAQLWIFQ
jgi:hypothetical protein